MARSTFPSQNVQSTPGPDDFWKLRCRKSARRSGAKHILKSKCTKHTILGPLLEVEMSKKCTPLWREAHFEVKMYKAPHVRATFGGSDLTPLWREAHFEVKMYKTLGVRTTFGGSDVASLRFGSLHYTIHSTTLQYITLHYTTLHNTSTTTTELHNYTPLHSTTLDKLQYTTPQYTTLHYTTLHYTTLYIPLHYATLHYTIHSTHYSTLHYTTLHNTTTTTTELHNYTPLHSTTHRYTKVRPAISFEECKQRCFARPNHLGQDLKLWRSVRQRIQKFLHVWHGSKGPFLFSIEWLFTQVQHPMVLWGAPPKIGTSTMRIFA